MRRALQGSIRDLRQAARNLQGGRVALIGVAIGLAAAFFLTRSLASLLYGVRALEPAVLATVSGLMIAVALLASYVPARRASAVDPMVSLRAE